MARIENIVEYYDELFPVTESQKKFYAEETENLKKPVKYLRIGCGTGIFENYLAREGEDVTGIEPFKELADCANRQRRTPLMSIRFFQMTTLEMSRFLGKSFYNVISCLDDRIEMISDAVLLRKFFFDVKGLLSKDGKFIIKMINFDHFKETVEQLPEISNIRVKLKTKITTQADGSKSFSQEIETGNGRMCSVFENVKIYPLKKAEIIEFGKEAGFSDFTFYGDYDRKEFDSESLNLIAVLS
ncbi:methyltransferase domain-containing protein [Treponema parvum]|uniref:Methyltransferase domain-containing protein n=1 Tax=Treponema parvum TaxID=138851 RepID=A0A975F5W9_9SPIR|nr:methyltransferase domain-containing protein [Treponema parvum]QTQ14935.1 methyltransferase domain-containing protein [Treponema parvum]